MPGRPSRKNAANAFVYSVRGLAGARHATWTKFTLSAEWVVLVDPTTREASVVMAPGSLTVDALVAGPITNGRDQSAVFAPTVWLHIYYIYNGTTLALTVSTTAPPTGPALPSGYTQWAYATTIRWDAGDFEPVIVSGCHVHNRQVIYMSAGTATAFTLVTGTISDGIPPNARTVQGNAQLATTSNGSGVVSSFGYLASSTSGVPGSHEQVQIKLDRTGEAVNTPTKTDWHSFDLILQTSQAFYYAIATVNGTAASLAVAIHGYTVSNGDGD